MSKWSFSDGIVSSLQDENSFFERPRLHKLLEKAFEYPLLLICAGTGYGKTATLHSFLSMYNADIAHIQLSELDNDETYFWQRYIKTLSAILPESKVRMKDLFNDLNFPDTKDAYNRYRSISGRATAASQKCVIVFDNLHVLHSPAVLNFIKQLAKHIQSNTTLAIVSRSTPDFSMVNMIMRETVYMITEDALRFTEDEITRYLHQQNISALRTDVRTMFDETQGWAFAVNMIVHSISKGQTYNRYSLEAMKKNIFRLIEEELSQTASTQLLRFLVQLSLLDKLSANLVTDLAKASLYSIDTLLSEIKMLNAYIRYDFKMDSYIIHHLFLQYIRKRQTILSEDEVKDTYRTAALWYDENGFDIDAISHYEKAGDYDEIIKKAALLNIQVSENLAHFTLQALDHFPEECKLKNKAYPALYLKLKLCTGNFNNETMLDAQRYAEYYEARGESPERNSILCSIYLNWAILRLLMCTYTDIYDFNEYTKKMKRYFNASSYDAIPSSSITLIYTWVSLVGTNRLNAQEEFRKALSLFILDTNAITGCTFSGCDDLAYGELLFYQAKFDDAEQHIKRALDKVRSNTQYMTRKRALLYLMQIAFIRGEYESASKVFKDIEKLLAIEDRREDDGIRCTLFDIASGFFHLTIGDAEEIPEWLKGDFAPYAHPSFLENFANQVKLQYHYQTRQYNALLAYIESTLEKPTVLFGKIELTVLKALSLYQLKQRSQAMEALLQAYTLAESNGIILPFIIYAKDMRTLTATTLRTNKTILPSLWLKNINRKASTLAKRKTHLIAKYREVNNTEGEIKLTKRETEILKDIANGLSRSEIASSRDISVNTVKMVVNSIYDKLFANSMPDAIRIAVGRKII